MANDEQLRNVQFWLLGSLGGARWSAVLSWSAAVVAVAGVLAPGSLLARPLNAMALGEAQAALMGVNVERVKRVVIGVTALAVGAVTATTGIIGFIGLVSPALRAAGGRTRPSASWCRVRPCWVPHWCWPPMRWRAPWRSRPNCHWVC